jgi:hypothetical protein
MSNQLGVKIKVPFGKVAAFCASLIMKAKGGISKEEGHELLAEFLELFAEVLSENVRPQ